jgi:site-specific recombinase XerD
MRIGCWLRSLLMADDGNFLEMAGLAALPRGELRETGNPWMPFELVDVDGGVVAPVAAYLKDVQACGRSESTLRSYGMDLLRWFRFCWSADLEWGQVTRAEAADFCRWLMIAGRPGTDGGYAPATVAHCETVLRHFYDFHLEAGTGPMVNPFPLARRRGRRSAHHNPMDPFAREGSGLFRPRMPRRAPRCIPDKEFGELFARFGSHRDRALVAFWVSTGARASELLGATAADADPGQQLITVIRKGTRALQQLPASPDAFVWLRLYQEQMRGLVPAGRDQPLWWTLRRPFRQLTYHAALRMFTRVAQSLGKDWTLHDLRHTAAYRMARDPEMPLADIQWVLGHARLSTTQLYLIPVPDDVIASVIAFHERRARPTPPPETGSGYRAETLQVLFGPDA